MPKLLAEKKFIDVSDYGRKPAIYLSSLLKNTSITPIQVTIWFGIIGLLAVYCIIKQYFLWAAILLILKSIVDAMDGELARIKETPSYSGRYLDSIFDSILNLTFIYAIGYITESPLWLIGLCFICVQFQGTLYNYYYVILRHRSAGGDTTSKIFELKPPTAFPIESQKTVNILFQIYMFLYSPFDKSMYYLDSQAYKSPAFPNWFMSLVSFYGLGFQLLLIGVMLVVGFASYILPFLIFYTMFSVFLIGIRKFVLKTA